MLILKKLLPSLISLILLEIYDLIFNNATNKKIQPQFFHLQTKLSTMCEDQQSVTTYFAKLRTLWNELASHCSACTCKKCSCDGVKDLTDYFQTEYVIIFLMSLNVTPCSKCCFTGSSGGVLPRHSTHISPRDDTLNA